MLRNLRKKNAASGMEHKPLSLECFPVEILQAFLSYVFDARSLKNLILSASFHHCGFLAAEPLILQDVLRNEFDARVLPDALATYAFARLPPQRGADVRDFLSRYYHSAAALPEIWSISDSIGLSQIHDNVE